MKNQLPGLIIGALICALLFWVFRAGDPQKMSFMGVTLANPETQESKVIVENIGVHSVIGNGAHSHGTMTAAEQTQEKENHTKAEADIFLKPGGYYTLADIEKNGKLPPSQKFKDIASRHDLKVHRGEPICPITETRANDRFFWWVGGKRYTFCCPPCIEEFVLKAKKRDSETEKGPDFYVKK